MTRSPFVFDEFTDRHLTAWFDAGSAPNDWDRETLAEFKAWVIANADDLYDDESWPGLAAHWERVRANKFFDDHFVIIPVGFDR